MCKQYSGQQLKLKVKTVTHILDNCHQVLSGFKLGSDISIAYLEAVAGIRYAMMEVAALLHSSQEGAQQQLTLQLMQVTEGICTDAVINTTDFTKEDVVGPCMYLLKLIVRVYGRSSLQRLSGEYPWLIPQGLCTTNQVNLLHACIYNAFFTYLHSKRSSIHL